MLQIGEKTYGEETVIPNGEILYKYLYPKAIPPGQKEIDPATFSQKEMSCDWAKIQKTPESSFHIKEGKTIIASITVCQAIRNPRNPKNKGEIEPAWKQHIVHDPITENEDPKNGSNPSHSLIYGKKRGPVQEAISNNCTWREVPPQD